MTPLKRALLTHLCGTGLVALGVSALVCVAIVAHGEATRVCIGVAALGILLLGAYLVARGLRDSAVAIAYAAMLGDERGTPGLLRQLREEVYLALEHRLGSTDAESRRAIFERYYHLNPHLDQSFADPAQARRREVLLQTTLGPLALEVGCATGGITAYLRQHGIECVGVDISFEQVRHAVANGGLCVQADAYRLPFRSGSVDTVLLPEVLEHLHEPPAALAEAARVARRRVVISVPDRSILDPTHVHVFDQEAVRHLVEQVPSLCIIQEHEISPFLVVVCQRGSPTTLALS